MSTNQRRHSDFDGQCCTCFPAHLASSTETPFWARQAYITGGYRKDLCLMDCFKSIWYFHNETLNIWTNLFGTFLWLITSIVFYYDYSSIPRDLQWTQLLYTISCSIGQFLSALWHISRATKNRTLYVIMSRIDFFGIILVIIASNVPLISLGFYCNQFWFYFFSCVTCITAPFMMLIVFSDYLAARQISRVIAFSASACIPITEVLILYYLEVEPFWFILRIVITPYAWYVLGIIFYVTRIPEYFSPGVFNIFGSSHQWWHLFVLIAQYTLFIGSMSLMNYRLENTCKTF
eukprot:TRINITY_DN1193_c0_g2_i3.p1 TRINITY_DN1193_c0_g2~~TRINITY_DN1193_c0_g2_i3.p1  ORF type:complete len:291 (-),score=11.72 TRINITY_DN1193_c0_g2_i3:152-1024(-)